MSRSARSLLVCIAGCYTAEPVGDLALGDVVFTYPADGQRDVPLGAHVLVSFVGPVGGEASASVVGPDGAVAITTTVTGAGHTLAIAPAELAPATRYEVHAGDLAFAFTTRSDRPRSGSPSLIALNGSDPLAPRAFRPIFESSTLQLVFSEPLDPRTVAIEPGAIELVDATGTAVPVTLIAKGIHASLDPQAALIAGATYELRLGEKLVDLGGEAAVPTTFAFTPIDSLGRGAIHQTFRTRTDADPNAAIARTDAINVMQIVHPLIGEATGVVQPSVLETELGDPRVLDGPIAFRIPKGQRLSASGLDIVLGGAVPSGLTTGDIQIELLTDGGGRLYRSPFQPADTLPDNERSPVQVDLSFDLAIYATDPTGNAALAQTILGVQLTGLAIADNGSLAIETLGTLDIGLLGISSAPTSIVLDLVSDPGATPARDTSAPLLLATLPAADAVDLATDDGIELVFDEPIDLARGGISLHDGDQLVPAAVELHGSVAVIRPRASLRVARTYRIELADVADVAGNVMEPTTFAIATRAAVTTPPVVLAVYPGAPCSLVDANAETAGRCAGGATADDRYQPFALAANERIAVVFDQPMLAASLVLGATCDTGSVRIERVDAAGACLEVVAGTLERHQRDVAFVPDRPWTAGEAYRLRLISGTDARCDANEVCSATNRTANFDPLAGTAGGGPDLAIAFAGTAATTATTLLAGAQPGADNRVALAIAGTSGLITSASFVGADCVPETPAIEACMYMLGVIPAQLGERRDNCTLPDGSVAPSCIPVAMGAEAMYSTSITMRAAAMGIPLTTATGTSVMRIREPADRPLEGYIIERDGGPVMVVALELYLDAPEMSLPLSQHDMHSKPLAVELEGPLTFEPDGRLAITLRNLADMPIEVGINAPLGITGTVALVAPAGEMQLRLVSAAQRGSLP
ncbi:MAG: Ig-like domain-containing protein [Kofleriaceae bacterium]